MACLININFIKIPNWQLINCMVPYIVSTLDTLHLSYISKSISSHISYDSIHSPYNISTELFNLSTYNFACIWHINYPYFKMLLRDQYEDNYFPKIHQYFNVFII